MPPGVENPSWALAVELPATIPIFALVVVAGFIPICMPLVNAVPTFPTTCKLDPGALVPMPTLLVAAGNKTFPFTRTPVLVILLT